MVVLFFCGIKKCINFNNTVDTDWLFVYNNCTKTNNTEKVLILHATKIGN